MEKQPQILTCLTEWDLGIPWWVLALAFALALLILKYAFGTFRYVVNNHVTMEKRDAAYEDLRLSGLLIFASGGLIAFVVMKIFFT